MTEFEYTTTLNGGIVSVWLDLTKDDDGSLIPSFNGVFFECMDITPILSKEQISELEMEAEAAFIDHSWELKNAY